MHKSWPTCPHNPTSKHGRNSTAVFGIDVAGKVRFANSQFERLPGHSRDQLRGTRCAGGLCVSTQAVRTHFKNSYQKIGVHSRTEAVVFALQQGLI